MRRLLVAFVALCTLVPAAPALAAGKAPDDRIVVSGPVLVDRGETVPGDVVVLQGDVLIRGIVGGDVVVVDGDLTVRGKIKGDAVTIGGRATLGRAARISGDLSYGDKKPVVAPGAKVSGKTKKFDGSQFKGTFKKAALLVWVAFLISFAVLGLLLLLLAPRAADAIARTAKHKWAMAIGVGVAAFILLPVIAVALLVSVFGAPLGVILLLALPLVFALGWVSAALAIGRLVLKNSKLFAFVLGLVILTALTLVPYAGGLFGLLGVIFGLGLLFTTLLRARSG